MTDVTAAAIIDKLGLAPHPEGGWYRQTWKAETAPGERPGATAIHFLLEAHQRSHWHKVDAAELWLWHAGDPLTLSIAPSPAGPVQRITLGSDVLAGQQVQALVPKDHWQATDPIAGWGLVSCVVAPGFEFAGFELAPEGWAPGDT